MQPESGKEAGIGGGGTGGGGGATGVALLPSRETPSTLSFSFLLLISYVLLKSFSFLTTPGFPFFFCWLRAWYLGGLIVGGEGYFWNQYMYIFVVGNIIYRKTDKYLVHIIRYKYSFPRTDNKHCLLKYLPIYIVSTFQRFSFFHSE